MSADKENPEKSKRSVVVSLDAFRRKPSAPSFLDEIHYDSPPPEEMFAGIGKSQLAANFPDFQRDDKAIDFSGVTIFDGIISPLTDKPSSIRLLWRAMTGDACRTKISDAVHNLFRPMKKLAVFNHKKTP